MQGCVYTCMCCCDMVDVAKDAGQVETGLVDMLPSSR